MYTAPVPPPPNASARPFGPYEPRGTGDLAKDLRFRDALRADPNLAEGYARIKQEIVDRAGGPLDGVIYQAEKGGWILDVYDRLGIERPANVGSGPTGEADRGTD